MDDNKSYIYAPMFCNRKETIISYLNKLSQLVIIILLIVASTDAGTIEYKPSSVKPSTNRPSILNTLVAKLTTRSKKTKPNGSVHLKKYRQSHKIYHQKKVNDFPFQWVSSSSFALSSDLIYDPENEGQLSLLNPESVIYVESIHLEDFQKQGRLLLHHPFIIISGTNDHSVPSEISKLDTQALLNDPNLVHWYTQNYDGTVTHPKLSAVPIGPNFHSLDPDSGESQKQHIKRGGKNKPIPYIKQSEKLANLAMSMPTIAERIPKIYYDAHISPNYSRKVRKIITLNPSRKFLSRQQILEEIRKKNGDSLVVQQQEMPRDEQWQSRTKYVFSISPVGNGLDCHRTWESLMLGQIVIMQSSPLDPLFEGLPVVIVKNWDEVTQENLDIWIERYSDATTNPEFRKRLTFKYWYNKTHDFSQRHAKVETNNPLYNFFKIINSR